MYTPQFYLYGDWITTRMTRRLMWVEHLSSPKSFNPDPNMTPSPKSVCNTTLADDTSNTGYSREWQPSGNHWEVWGMLLSVASNSIQD